ncbi:MAG TPA: methyltransferase domain-containing protein [Gammaproteobacteria bacterium]|nr:methyltransferase domain-containing protein [Gammaproteobacteria bacterium]
MSTAISDVVARTRDYYDGAANEIYRDIWGENIHMGLFADPDEDLPTAMARSNEVMARGADLSPSHEVLEVGCGYGGLARFLAANYGARVLATNISDKELGWGRELTEQAGLGHRVDMEWADFHELPYRDGRFHVYWSQEAFLHAADKRRVLDEAYRVLRPGGRLVVSELLVHHGTPEAERARIYERVGAPEMWDAPDYDAALADLGFRVLVREDWSRHVARSYGWVRAELERRRAEFERRVGRDVVDTTSEALGFWVAQADAGRIGWIHYVADK